MNKRYFAVPAVLFLIICSLSCSPSAQQRIVKAEKGTFHIKVHALGRLQSAASIDVGCPAVHRIWNYKISSMAPEGKKVKKGELILSFDPKELMETFALTNSELETSKKELEKTKLVEQEKMDKFRLQLAQAQADTEKAQRKAGRSDEFDALIEVKKFKMDYELAKLSLELCKSQVDNQASAMKTRIHSLESKVKSLQKKVAELRTAMEKMKVKAPKDGIVVYGVDWRGRKKAVGDDCWMGDKIMELPDLTRMEAAAVIPEPQAGKIKTGLPVEIRLDSNPDKVFKGEVKSIGRIFRTKSSDQPTIVFDAVISIKDPDPESMRPGMAAGIDIIISSREDVLYVPEAAVIYHEKGLSVLKKTFFSKKRVPVTLGERSLDMVEVLSGVKENDRLIVPEPGEEE